jgi:hypothetical protein
VPERTVNAPEKDWLTREEAAAWLNVDVSVFLDLVKEGLVPPPIELPRRQKRWHWMDAVAVAHLITRQRPPHREHPKKPRTADK